MKYTKEIPTKPGWYWVRNSEGRKRILEAYYAQPGNRFVLDGSAILMWLGFEFAGPIEEPEE